MGGSIKLQRSIIINAPGEKIWPFLVEPQRIIQWCSPVKVIRLTGPQSAGLGTTFYFEEKACGMMMKLNFTVTEWVLHSSVAFKLTAGNLVNSYSQRYTIVATPSGSCCTCFEEVSLPFGILGTIAGRVRKFTSIHLLDTMLLNLKNTAEL
jgi:hypothetical protein